MLAIVAPGQGAQKPGFLADWLALDSFANGLAELSEAAELDLAHFGIEADEETIKDTSIAQPLLVAAALLVADELGVTPDVTAGHSVGEIGAAGIAGVLDRDDAIRFVTERGRAMAEAAAATPSGMSAILAGKAEEVLARIEELGLTPANHNGKGQIVAAGALSALEKLKENPPARTRVVPLKVAGAFHTEFMSSAVDRLAALAKKITPHPATVKLLSNKDGQVVSDGQDYLNRLVGQVTTPVRWDLCMETMTQLGVTGLLELTPAKTLTGIAKRNMKVERFDLNTPDQLDEARAFCAEHKGN
ncbi:ACP S-malonyltransferase [Propionimicrobium lymphophilum]|uniref:ACP S-malonyltransferase n=1 Tax=Propionimicrobium lymphophilum TaxID=33012 RepID=UPI0004134012|nr:ACP S-malonyltransferase [Propionimicrobium lymphophilum]